MVDHRRSQCGFVESEFYKSVAFMAVFVVVIAVIAVPAYQDYRNRSFLNDVFAASREATEAVDAHWRRTKAFPERLIGHSQDIRSLEIDPKSGAITVTLHSRNGQHDALAGKILVLTPTLQPDRTLRWTCRGPGISERLLPRECR